MEEKLPCDRHEEQIKTLFKTVEKLEDDRDFIHSLDKNMSLQTQMLNTIIESNDKQDKRMDEQHQTIIKINENLTELTEGQRTLNNRVGKLEDRVEENEDKQTIDIREIEKKKYTDVLYKIVLPAGIVSVIAMEIIKLIK